MKHFGILLCGLNVASGLYPTLDMTSAWSFGVATCLALYLLTASK